ncbi:MAG: hypothetical protein R2765_06805 [Ferruginibacter sp.]
MALVFISCKYKEKDPSAELVQHYRDSVSEARIDSAYKAIKSRCDTQMLYGTNNGRFVFKKPCIGN